MPEPIPLHRPVRMTEAEYDAVRAKLREAYGDSAGQAGVRREQELALLFDNSGWKQKELAEKEGKSQGWVHLNLRFGRFLNYNNTIVLNPETTSNNLNEGRFRKYWDQTERDEGASNEASEPARFAAIVKMLADPDALPPKLKWTTEAMVENFGDGKWHALKDIADELADGDEKRAEKSLHAVMYPRTQVKAERRKYGKSFEYRIFTDTDKSVSLSEMRTKLGPILKRLELQGKANQATMSPGTVAECVFLIKQLLDGWAK